MFRSSRSTAHGSPGAVGRALSRIVREGEIKRLSRGVFVRPRKSRFIGKVFPGVIDVVRVLAKKTVKPSGSMAQKPRGASDLPLK